MLSIVSPGHESDYETLTLYFEMSYQLQTLSYRVEDNGVYPELTRLKKEMETAYQLLQWYIRPYSEETETQLPELAVDWDENEQEIMIRN